MSRRGLRKGPEMMLRSLSLAVLLAAAPSLAQSPAPAPAVPAAAPAPAALAAATQLIDLVMPPASRDKMMEQLMTVMMQNMVGAISQSPQLQAAFEKEPRARPIFERSVARQQAHALDMIKAEMPAMMTVMARAYARRFSLAEMDDMKRFFSSPTGQAYVLKSPTVMSDPDVLAWSQAMMTRAMARGPAEAKIIADEIAALPPT